MTNRVIAALLLGVLIFIIPLVPLISLLIWLNEPGSPIFYRQSRDGQNRSPFMIWKFRTMWVGSSQQVVSDKNDHRITPIGRLLRRTHLDELPQLLNVMHGEMNFIGPRPLMSEQCEYYLQENPLFNKRFQAKPGLTGLQQICGRSGKNSLQYDLLTIRKQGKLYFRIWILYKTTQRVFSCSSV